MSTDKEPEDKALDDRSLFQKAMAQTNTVRHNNQARHLNRYDQRQRPPDKPASHYVSTGVPTPVAIDQTTQGESVLFVRSGLQHKRVKRLKRGEYPYQSVLDLHGMRVYQAETLLNEFLSESVRQNMSCVLIIHGKGHHSENSQGVLKLFTINWLKASAEVIAFCSAHPRDGGTGAVYVLLKKAERVENTAALRE